MADEIPVFLVEKDKVGLGYCVIATWPDGRKTAITARISSEGEFVSDCDLVSIGKKRVWGPAFP